MFGFVNISQVIGRLFCISQGTFRAGR